MHRRKRTPSLSRGCSNGIDDVRFCALSHNLFRLAGFPSQRTLYLSVNPVQTCILALTRRFYAATIREYDCCGTLRHPIRVLTPKRVSPKSVGRTPRYIPSHRKPACSVSMLAMPISPPPSWRETRQNPPAQATHPPYRQRDRSPAWRIQPVQRHPPIGV